jgi:putative DNA primase/helicase
MAATMFGTGWKYQRAVLLQGLERTGKSVVLEIMTAMMPANAVATLPPHQWGERFALTSLVGKVLNICGELPEDAMISGSQFKGIVTGETQRSEFKGVDSFEFKPLASHWFASNHLPRSKDTSGGFTRRWIIFEFTRQIPEAEKIVNLAEEIVSEEREAIAAWAVEGLKRLRAQREYTLPASHRRLENSVLRSNNSVAAFLQSCERVRPDEESTADVKHVFDQYRFYMKEVSGGYGVGFESFKNMLKGLKYTVEAYRDPLGVTRDKVRGLKMNVPMGVTS